MTAFDSMTVEAGTRADVLLVAFGGIAGGFALPPFEFNRLTQDLGCNRLFIRDLSQAWYQKGVPGMGDTVRQMVEGLRVKLAALGSQRTVLIGNSMGGFAALMFGGLLNVPEVHAFAPQTFVDFRSRLLAADFRWRHQIRAMHKGLPAQDAMLDVRPVLRAAAGTRFHVYFGTADRLDRLHARRLVGLSNVILHACENGNHALVKDLRDNGVLGAILKKALLI